MYGRSASNCACGSRADQRSHTIPQDSALLTNAGCPNGTEPYPYNRNRYTCWAGLCNSTTDAPPDCFNGTMLCQHGPGECAGNSIENCAKFSYPSQPLYTSFVYCFEASCTYDSDNPFNSTCNTSAAFLEQCGAYAGIDAAPIIACFEDATLTAQLDLAAAHQTAALGTSKLGTPWVLVNGEPLDDTDDLLSAVCDAWSAQDGAVVPSGCPGAPVSPYDWKTWQEGATLGVGVGGGLLLGLLVALFVVRCRRKKESGAGGVPLLPGEVLRGVAF